MRYKHYPATDRSGMVLILVLIVVSLLTLGSYAFSELMLTERRAAEAQGKRLQTRNLAESGVNQILHFLTNDSETRIAYGGMYDNPEMFRGILAAEGLSPAERGRFTVLSPAYEFGDRVGMRFGLENESARLNLNLLMAAEETTPGAGQLFLMALPGMTEDVADAILDWLDADEETRPSGAETEYYANLMPGYAANNGPIHALEELLLVRGVTPRMLFGLDEDRNGVIDSRERQLEVELEVDNTDRSMDFGWSAYLTLNSAESNLQLDGIPKINLNQDDLELLYEELLEVFPEELANFIIAARQYGFKSPSEEDEAAASSSSTASTESAPEPDFSKTAAAKFTTILDLIGATVSPQDSSSGSSSSGSSSGGSGGRSSGSSSSSSSSISAPISRSGSGGPGQSSGQRRGSSSSSSGSSSSSSESTETYASPITQDPEVMAEFLPLLYEYVSVSGATAIPGRININQAPAILLYGIPNMSEEVVQEILNSRIPEATEEMPDRQFETWLLTEGIVSLSEMKSLMPLITGGGSIYRANVVGFFDSHSPMARIEAIIDTSRGTPRVISWREYSHLGGAYSRTELGSDAGMGTVGF